MNKLSISLILLLTVFVSGLTAEEPSNAGTAVAGVLNGMPDPAIVQAHDGSYYIFATGQGLPFYRSTDLVNWTALGRVFETAVPAWAKEMIPGTQGIWAPDIVKLNDRFYVYYCVSTFGSQRSVFGVASNATLDQSSPAYKWQDHGPVVESFASADCDYNAIDPAAIQTSDGKAYIVWGSYWNGIKFAELNPETGKLIDRAKIKTVATRRPAGGDAIEGAYLVQKFDYYYLFVSFDNCCAGADSTYKVMVGRSKNIEGPYLDHNGIDMAQGGATLVLANNDNWRGPGHNSVLTTNEGQWLVHHTYDTNRLSAQRVEQVRPIYWTEDLWPVAGEPLSNTNKLRTDKASVTASELVGSWRMSNNYGQEKIYDLLPGGKISFNKDARWSISGNELTISWKIDGKEYIDNCFVEPLKNSFIGRNQRGDVIRGKKI
ncbi:MAG: arabinan endo-1,5-alpha-L-arabinosidase [Sedimentisphaerales bacterium]|nr:arabinan endo-1,5-alpha-L-arabinosidase [Sedimentisphaerales bacterium]